MELLLGCGRARSKRLFKPGHEQWSGLKTVDFNEAHKPDIVCDISKLPLPFLDNSCSEIHAYDTLEHVGTQGDWQFFFAQWSEFWRMLEPGGIFFGISPHHSSPWAWGDPGHTRIISAESFIFLCQTNYSQIGKSPMTDYRFCYKADFDLVHSEVDEAKQLHFALRAVKPSRISE